MEDHSESEVLAQGPFEAYLAAHFAFAANFYAVHHHSVRAYLAATSGLETDSFAVENVTNVGDLLEENGLSWAEFAQGMPSPCDPWSDAATGYDPSHNPFVHYADIVDNASRCDAHVLNFTAWTSSLASGDLPAYSFVSPNTTNDDHNASVAVGDAWLSSWLSPFVNSSAFAHAAVLITYDESEYNDTSGLDGTDGGHIYTVLVSPFSRTAYASNTFYDTWDLLTTTEWLLGLGRTGQNDSWSVNPPMYDLFEYPVHGTVVGASGVALPNAEVRFAATGESWNLTTDGSGQFAAALSLGAYNVEASAPGYYAASILYNLSGPNSSVNFRLTPVPASFSAADSLIGTGIGALVAGTGVTAGMVVRQRRDARRTHGP